MNPTTVYQQLLSDKSYWQGLADHVAEQATIDSQSNFALHRAEGKLAAIDQALRRIAQGTFGKCDICGGVIESERLEVLLDSDCHRCAACARLKSHVIEHKTTVIDWSPMHQRRSHHSLTLYRAC